MSPWIFLVAALVLAVIQLLEIWPEFRQYTPRKKLTKSATLLVTISVAVFSAYNAYNGLVALEKIKSSTELSEREARAAASNTKTTPLSPAIITKLAAEIKSLPFHSASLSCEPATIGLCEDLRSALQQANIEPGYVIGTLYSDGNPHAIIIYGADGLDAQTAKLAHDLSNKSLDAVAIPYDKTYKPGSMNTPYPDVRIAVMHY